MKGKPGARKVVGIMLCVGLLCMLMPVTAGAAPSIPAVEQLTGISMDKEVLWSPGRLAIAGDGTLYVVDSYKNHILKFDRNGIYVGDMAVPRVSAIAVAPNGTLYIGSHQSYSVSVVRNGQVIGHLGAEQNEFQSIKDIAHDPVTGHTFVADNAGNAVRIFDAAGRDLGSIAGINLPIGIEVTADAIYVLDAPVVQSEQGITTASRISVFDKSLNLIGSIDDYGNNQMFRPTDIAVSGGILYITDAAYQSVVLFDTTGIFLGEIQSILGPMRTAVSLAVSSDGILFVSSSQTRSIEMFAIGGRQ